MMYTVACPDPECETTFTVDKTPEQIADPADLTLCQECGGEFESEYDEDTKELTLIDPEELDEEDETCELCGSPIDECDEGEDDDA